MIGAQGVGHHQDHPARRAPVGEGGASLRGLTDLGRRAAMPDRGSAPEADPSLLLGLQREGNFDAPAGERLEVQADGNPPVLLGDRPANDDRLGSLGGHLDDVGDRMGLRGADREVEPRPRPQLDLPGDPLRRARDDGLAVDPRQALPSDPRRDLRQVLGARDEAHGAERDLRALAPEDGEHQMPDPGEGRGSGEGGVGLGQAVGPIRTRLELGDEVAQLLLRELVHQLLDVELLVGNEEDPQLLAARHRELDLEGAQEIVRQLALGYGHTEDRQVSAR
jgi:hypothetical protein